MVELNLKGVMTHDPLGNNQTSNGRQLLSRVMTHPPKGVVIHVSLCNNLTSSNLEIQNQSIYIIQYLLLKNTQKITNFLGCWKTIHMFCLLCLRSKFFPTSGLKAEIQKEIVKWYPTRINLNKYSIQSLLTVSRALILVKRKKPFKC